MARAGASLARDAGLAAALYAALLLGIVSPAAAAASISICSVSLPGGGKAAPDADDRHGAATTGHCAGMATAALGPVDVAVARPLQVTSRSLTPTSADRLNWPLAVRRVARGPPADRAPHRRK